MEDLWPPGVISEGGPRIVSNVGAVGESGLPGGHSRGPAWTPANGKCVAVGGEGLAGLELRSNMTRDAQDVCRGSRGGHGGDVHFAVLQYMF